MPSHPLAPDVALGITIGCVMTRNRYEADTARVIAELYEIAGDRLDLLAQEVGSFIGFYEDSYTIRLTTALRALPLDMADAIGLGQYRRGVRTHSTSNFGRPPGVGEPA